MSFKETNRQDSSTPQTESATDSFHRASGQDGEPTINLRNGTASAQTPIMRPRPAMRQWTPVPADAIGVIGDFELLSEVGCGGMGIVYKARHRALKRTVALKVTRAGPSFSEKETQGRFRVEAEAAAKLDHPNIVPIYETGRFDGQFYFSMAYVEGNSLAQEVAGGPLLPGRAAELIRTTAKAVAYAHAQGVIHRDLKPENILLDASDQPRITDFGLAKCTDVESCLTQAGDVMGTPSYMPPEQIEGLDQVCLLADVYSLGATLYCLLTGRPPFQAATPLETAKQVMEREPPPPRQINPGVDRDLETICLKCLDKRPERRYLSATALADDLTRFLERRPIKARRTHPLEKAVRWCRRNPLVTASLSSVVGIFMASFALVSSSYWQAVEAQRIAERKGALERWERYRSHLAAAASDLQLNNHSTAKRFLLSAPAEHRGWEWRYLMSQLDRSQFVLDIAATAFVIHPTEQQMAIGTRAGAVRWICLETGRTLAVSSACASQVNALSFSPDGIYLAAGCENGEIRIWKNPSLNHPILLRNRGSPIFRLFFSRDGARLAANCPEPRVPVWDVATGTRLPDLQSHAGGNFVPTADLSRLVSKDGINLFAVGSAGGKETTVIFEGHSYEPIRIAIDPSGTLLASASVHPDNAVRIWELATGKQLALLEGHKNAVTSLAFSPDGALLVSGSIDQKIRTWDVKSGALRTVLPGHTNPVHCVAFSSDGTRLASTSGDGTARLWDARTGEPMGVLRGHQSAIYEVCFSSDGTRLVTRSNDLTLRIWETRLCEGVSFHGHAGFVYDAAISPNGKQVASVAWDGKLALCDLSSGKLNLQMKHDASIVSSVAFSRDGSRLATLSRFNKDQLGRVVTVWNAANGAKIFSTHLPFSNYKDSRVAFHPRKDLVAAGDPKGKVYLLDSETGAIRARFTAHKSQVLDVTFSPDGDALVSASADGTVKIWNAAALKEITVLKGHTADVYRVTFNRDGTLLATASGDRTVRLWAAGTYKQIAELPHGCAVYGLSFSLDGRRLATGCADNSIRLWDLKTFQEVAELRGHESYVHAVAFTPDGTQLLSGSGDHTVRIWDTLSPRERARMVK